MDTFFKSFGYLRPLLAAFFVTLLIIPMSAVAQEPEDRTLADAMALCHDAESQFWAQMTNPTAQHNSRCDARSRDTTDSAWVVGSVVLYVNPFGNEYSNGVWQYGKADLCANTTPFTGWMDFSGNNPGVVCKEGCGFVLGDGNSGANDQGQQRFVGSFEPLGRSCTASENAATGTASLGDPPPSTTPGQGGDGGNSGTNPGGTGGGNSGGNTGGDGNGGTGGDPAHSGSTGGNNGGNQGGDNGNGNGNQGGGNGGNGSGGSGSGGNGSGGNGSGGNGSGGTGGGGNGSGGNGSNDPAPGSSTGGSKGSYNGDSCDAPPACTGDAVMCGVATETHRNRCVTEKALVGTGDAPESGKHTVSEVIGPDVDTGSLDKIDTAGFGFGTTCPFHSGEIARIGDQPINQDFGPICEYGPWMRGFILALAALACAYILSGHTRSGGLI